MGITLSITTAGPGTRANVVDASVGVVGPNSVTGGRDNNMAVLTLNTHMGEEWNVHEVVGKIAANMAADSEEASAILTNLSYRTFEG